jgi:hypothetical protein
MSELDSKACYNAFVSGKLSPTPWERLTQAEREQWAQAVAAVRVRYRICPDCGFEYTRCAYCEQFKASVPKPAKKKRKARV